MMLEVSLKGVYLQGIYILAFLENCHLFDRRYIDGLVPNRYLDDGDAPIHPALLNQKVHHRHEDERSNQLGHLEYDVPDLFIVSIRHFIGRPSGVFPYVLAFAAETFHVVHRS